MNGNTKWGGGYKANSPLDWIKCESRRVEETSRGRFLACLGDEWAEQHRLVTACMARSTALAAATNPQLHRLVTACMARSTALAAATNPQLHRLVTACMARSTDLAAAPIISSTNKYRKQKQYAYLSVAYRQNDNYTDIYGGKMADCCQKVRGHLCLSMQICI